MAFEEGTEILTCPNCKARHSAKWSRMPVREMQTIRCDACRGILHSRSSVRDYYEVNLIDEA